MLVVAVISVDADPFLAFSDQICHLDDTGIQKYMCHVYTLPHVSKDTELGMSGQ